MLMPVVAYDRAGRATRVTNPRSKATTFGHDLAGRKTLERNAQGQDRTWAYDPNGG